MGWPGEWKHVNSRMRQVPERTSQRVAAALIQKETEKGREKGVEERGEWREEGRVSSSVTLDDGLRGTGAG